MFSNQSSYSVVTSAPLISISKLSNCFNVITWSYQVRLSWSSKAWKVAGVVSRSNNSKSGKLDKECVNYSLMCFAGVGVCIVVSYCCPLMVSESVS